MNFFRNFLFLFGFCLFFISVKILSLNTFNPKNSSTVYTLGTEELYTSGGEVWGWVNYHAGFNLSSSTTLKLGIVPHIKAGDVKLAHGSCLELLADLHLSRTTCLYIGSSSGDAAYLKGNNGTLFFHGNLGMPDNRNLYVLDDTIIDGQGWSLFLSNGFQLLIDSGVTLTLRNISLKQLKGSANSGGGIVLLDNSSNLALQNVLVDVNGTYSFDIGSLFIHGDVIINGGPYSDQTFSGTLRSSFVHSSIYDIPNQKPLIIDKNSMLYFDNGMTFVYDHHSASSDLCKQQIIMTDTSSRLYINGSTLQVPVDNSQKGGLVLWRGTLMLDNRVSFSNYNLDTGWVNKDEAKGITFGQPPVDLNIYVLGGARVETYGYLNYLNQS
ncbi:MAG: hypothetical protein FK734_04990 [Asgard group archaeon]|nr:hypothetical protein [Asgard group archaeon]